MYQQVAVTRTKIASSYSSGCMRRGLKLQYESQIQKTNEPWNGRILRSRSTIFKSGTASTEWHRDLSVCKNNRSLCPNKKVGLGVVTACLLRSNAYFPGAPCRTLKTGRGKEVNGATSPGFFSRIRNKIFGESGAAAKPVVPQEKLNALLRGLPTYQANAVVSFFDGYISAIPSHGNQQSRTYRWLRNLRQLLAIAVLGALLFPLSAVASLTMNAQRERAANNNNEVNSKTTGVTFRDVKGVDEAKSELLDVIHFLRNPRKFAQLGAKLPNGILLVGAPGTGKTLLARAVAGEAGVPFFHIAGSEVEGMLVGQGAMRIRDLFKAAKARAPCVIFIDEIDSIGKKRTESACHPYANQTINQLLTEMDGFHKNDGVIVLAATNHVEALDQALLRPGRFDVKVQVSAPELNGRKAILEHYLGKVKRGNDVDVDRLARRTPGFTPAELQNLVNQAALKAGVEGAEVVSRRHLEFAYDKILLGAERKSLIQDKETSWITAYHESGHALVAYYTKDADPVHKVTILPRGSTLGHTSFMPEREGCLQTRAQLMAILDGRMGGRAAEELIFGAEKVTSGAFDDLEHATSIATSMVKHLGMSERIGRRTVGKEVGSFMTELIDSEVNKVLEESYERAKKILLEHSKELHALAEALMKHETLDADAIKAVLAQVAQKEFKNVAE